MMVWNQWQDLETPEQREARIAEVRTDWNRVKKYTHGYYVNLNDEDQEKTNANYGANYERLVGIKDRFDPGNLMRLNANIQPSA